MSRIEEPHDITSSLEVNLQEALNINCIEEKEEKEEINVFLKHIEKDDTKQEVKELVENYRPMEIKNTGIKMQNCIKRRKACISTS